MREEVVREREEERRTTATVRHAAVLSFSLFLGRKTFCCIASTSDLQARMPRNLSIWSLGTAKRGTSLGAFPPNEVEKHGAFPLESI